MKFSLLFLLVLIYACSYKNTKLGNQTQKGHEELYSHPEKSKIEPGHRKIVIASTNDIQGHFSSHTLNFRDQENPDKLHIELGGVDIISSYFKIIREQNNGILLVDSGNIFPDKSSQLSYVQDFYSTLGYDAVTVGLRDFNLRLDSKYPSNPDFFKDFAQKSKVPLLLGNLYDVKSGRVVEWPGTAPYIIKEVNGIKVGVLGIIPDDIVTQTPVDNRVGLFMEGMLQSTLRQARLLRSLGAELIVVITHQGINCGEKMAEELKLPISKVNFDPNRADACDLNNKMGDYLNRLPPKLVDVVISGRVNQKTVNYVNGILVLSNFPEGKSFNIVEFYADEKTKKINHELTQVHQPTMFCREFFKETMDCYTEDTSVDHKVRVPALFLETEVFPDTSIHSKFSPFIKPEINESTNADVDVNEALKALDASLIYRSKDRGDTKLVSVEITGQRLASILDIDYNLGRSANWIPSPFSKKASSILINIDDGPLINTRVYRILADLEDLQSHASLRHFINHIGTKTYAASSWDNLFLNDDVTVSLSASSDTVR